MGGGHCKWTAFLACLGFDQLKQIANLICVHRLKLIYQFLDTAYAKNCKDSQWYSFDDSSVSAVDQEQITVSSRWISDFNLA